MGLGGLRVGIAGREFGHAQHAKCIKQGTTKQEIPMVAMVTDEQTGHGQGPLRPISINETKQQQERGRSKPKRATENPKDRPANMHTTTHQFCI